jgi:DeoR family glycerol-3-phosphate regulon repressor
VTVQPLHPTLSARQNDILNKVRSSGFVTIEALAAEYGVSTQTVRRDLIALAKTGLLQRFHGGAGPADDLSAARLDYREKRDVSREEKVFIGRQAAQAMPDGASLFLDVGTTLEACAEELNKRDGFLIVTPSIRTALVMDPARHTVHVLGGRMAGRDGSLVGEEVVRRLSRLTFDYALIGCSAIDASDRVMDFDPSKIEIKKTAMAVARSSVLLASRSKFGRTAFGSIGKLSDFSQIFTSKA